MASSAKLNTKYARQLSSKEGPKTTAKPASIPKANQSSGLGTAVGLALVTVTALQLPTVLRENGVIDFDPYENVPFINEFLAPLTEAMRAADLLPAKKTSTPVEKKEAQVYHHKTTAEVVAESHKSDPYGVPEVEPAHEEPVKENVVEAAAVVSEELTVAEQEAVHVAESAVDDVASVVTDAVTKSEEAVEVTVDPAEIISEALVAAPPAEEAHQAAAGGLPEVGAEISMKSASSSSASREILQSAAKSSVALRQELESLMLKDIQTMDAAALRLRVTQLATELFERLSWENMRLNHAIAQVEEELTGRYERLFTKQRQELEFEVEKILFEKEKAVSEASAEQAQALEAKYAAQMQQAIKAQAEGFQATLQQSLKEQHDSLVEDFQSQANQHHAMLRKQHNDQLLQTQGEIESLRQQVIACQKVLNELGGTVEDTLNSHTISTAVLSLESILSQPSVLLKKLSAQGHQSQGVKAHLDRVRSLAQGDELVVSIVDSLPARVQQDGAPTLSELQVRFSIMRDEARKAALAPEQAPKLIGQVIGTVLANISSTPSGYIAGPGVEESLARAAFFLERGKLKEAVVEVQGMEGYAKVIAQDWISLAEDRLLVDQALRALKANSIIRHRHLQN